MVSGPPWKQSSMSPSPSYVRGHTLVLELWKWSDGADGNALNLPLTTLWSFRLHMKISLSMLFIFVPFKFVKLKTTNELLFVSLFLSQFIVHSSSFNKNMNEYKLSFYKLRTIIELRWSYTPSLAPINLKNEVSFSLIGQSHLKP